MFHRYSQDVSGSFKIQLKTIKEVIDREFQGFFNQLVVDVSQKEQCFDLCFPQLRSCYL